MPEVINISHTDELVPTRLFANAKFPFEYFNPIQSGIFDYYHKDVNITVAAATSSGKTLCAEMFLADEVRSRGGKGVYIGPLKALTQEKIDDWTNKDHHFHDLKISICTGDYIITKNRIKELDDADIILMTPEMLSSRCRNCQSEKSKFLKEIGTIVFDESHLLGVPGRGDHMEVALMKVTEINPNIRMLPLSATMPNVDEICGWISNLTNKDTYYLESNYRPCPLSTHYQPYYDGNRKYEDNEAEKVSMAMQVIEHYPDDKFLIFTHTKRTGEMMKRALKRLEIEAPFHNSDLNTTKRIQLEKQFKEDPNLKVIIATSTLAWGCYKLDTPIAMSDGSLKNAGDVVKGDKVLSLDKTNGDFVSNEILKTEIKEFDTSYEVTLSSGEKVEVSPDHIFYGAIGRNSPDWVEVKNVTEGDYLAVPKTYIKPCNKKLIFFDKKSYLWGYALGDGCLVDCGKFANGEKKVLLDIAFGKHEKEHAESLRQMLIDESSYKDFPQIKFDSNEVLHISTKSKQVTDLFKMILPIGRKGDKLRIPNFILRDQTLLVSFLKGLFDADGGVESHSNKNWSVGLSSISESLIKDVQHALLLLGIRGEVGKKKMKDTVINGRKQKAVREYCWRVRIYNREMNYFFSNIGFHIKSKFDRLSKVLTEVNKLNLPFSTRDIFPARRLVLDHAEVNEISSWKMCKSLNIDKWNILNTSDIQRNTAHKILFEYPQESKLKKLLNEDVLWKKVLKIEKKNGGKFQEIAVDKDNNYIGGGIISHNCNLPARRVIVTGVHRGLGIVENYDIWQMVGRAGRPAFDPRGDAYILLPERKFEEWVHKLKTPQPIRSQLLDDVGGHYKTLAFHIVSEIHHEGIKNLEDLSRWYARSLAHYQSNDLDDYVIDNVVTLLTKCGAIKEENGEFKVTPVGKIASLFYYSPFDIADLKRNFQILFDRNREKDDYALAMTLANLDTHRMGIVSKIEKEDMSAFASRVEHYGSYRDSVIKAGYCYHMLLNGRSNNIFASYMRGLQYDFSRLGEVLNAIDGMAGKWGMTKFIRKIPLRITYGVGEKLLELCQLPNIGSVRANRLYDAGIRTLDEVIKNPAKVKAALNMKDDNVNSIVGAAKMIEVKGQNIAK